AWGSLVESIGLKAGHILLVRGGTSSLGMAATSIAKNMGATVVATTRSEAKREALLANGVDHVIIDTGQIAGTVRELYPEGVDHVLELVGTVTLRDSFQTVRPKGVICVAGLLGNEWVLREFSPFEIPSSVRLTTFKSETITKDATEALQRAVGLAEAGHYRLNLDRVFRMEEIVEAHQIMDASTAHGKLVIVVD
ncbi:MAG: zinc-binding dehydrogenase, partial [Thaumarchaeota archaeon]|nr:zinc-binding dehydrogenase [Nitrososphaerota archaeon]